MMPPGGKWVFGPSQKWDEFPHKIAAKAAINHKKCTQDEVSLLISDAVKFYNLSKEQQIIIEQLRNDLKIAEATVRLLQVEDQ